MRKAIKLTAEKKVYCFSIVLYFSSNPLQNFNFIFFTLTRKIYCTFNGRKAYGIFCFVLINVFHSLFFNIRDLDLGVTKKSQTSQRVGKEVNPSHRNPSQVLMNAPEKNKEEEFTAIFHLKRSDNPPFTWCLTTIFRNGLRKRKKLS